MSNIDAIEKAAADYAHDNIIETSALSPEIGHCIDDFKVGALSNAAKEYWYAQFKGEYGKYLDSLKAVDELPDEVIQNAIREVLVSNDEQFKSEQNPPFELYVSETNQASVFVRFKDGVKEYKVEVFNNNVCVHVYENGEKKGSYFKEYQSSEQNSIIVNREEYERVNIRL